MSEATKARPTRRIKRHTVVPKFDVNGRLFDSERDADLWADVLYRAERRVLETKPELTDKRAAGYALEIAEAMLEYRRETDAASDNSDPVDDTESGEISRVYVQDGAEFGGMTNGAG